MSTQKLICTEEKYSDNDGAYDVEWIWDGEKIDKKVLRGNMAASDLERATEEEREAAAIWFVSNNKEATDSRKCIGHTYEVKGSRKVAKGSIVAVIKFEDRYFNGRYWVDRKVTVKDSVSGEIHTISASCLHKWVSGPRPYWAFGF